MNSIIVSVYALLFSNGAIYVGITKDMNRRMEEHRRRQSVSTRRNKGNFKVIYEKKFEDYASARRHEKYLKSGAGKGFLRKQHLILAVVGVR